MPSMSLSVDSIQLTKDTVNLKMSQHELLKLKQEEQWREREGETTELRKYLNKYLLRIFQN